MFQKSSGPVCFSRAGKIYLHLSNVNYWLWRGSFIPTCQFAVLFAGPPPVLAIQSSLLVQKIPRIPIFLVVWFRRNPLDLIPIKSTQKKKKFCGVTKKSTPNVASPCILWNRRSSPPRYFLQRWACWPTEKGRVGQQKWLQILRFYLLCLDFLVFLFSPRETRKLTY